MIFVIKSIKYVLCKYFLNLIHNKGKIIKIQQFGLISKPELSSTYLILT